MPAHANGGGRASRQIGQEQARPPALRFPQRPRSGSPQSGGSTDYVPKGHTAGAGCSSNAEASFPDRTNQWERISSSTVRYLELIVLVAAPMRHILPARGGDYDPRTMASSDFATSAAVLLGVAAGQVQGQAIGAAPLVLVGAVQGAIGPATVITSQILSRKRASGTQRRSSACSQSVLPAYRF